MTEERTAHINYEKSKMITHTGDSVSDKEAYLKLNSPRTLNRHLCMWASQQCFKMVDENTTLEFKGILKVNIKYLRFHSLF